MEPAGRTVRGPGAHSSSIPQNSRGTGPSRSLSPQAHFKEVVAMAVVEAGHPPGLPRRLTTTL